MIPGAYEPNAPLYPARSATDEVPTTPFRELRPPAATAATSYVVHAPARPATRLGHAAAILGDLALLTAILFVAGAAPALVIWGIYTAAALILATWGRQ